MTEFNGFSWQPTPTFQIWPCSDKAKTFIDLNNLGLGEVETTQHSNTKYPWGQLRIGDAFAVPYDSGVTRPSLESTHRHVGIKTSKRFKVISHKNLKVWECVRIG